MALYNRSSAIVWSDGIGKNKVIRYVCGVLLILSCRNGWMVRVAPTCNEVEMGLEQL